MGVQTAHMKARLALQEQSDRPLKILLVEDDMDFGNVLHNTLAEISKTPITWCQSVCAARTALVDDAYSIVLTDLNLPDGAGTSLVAKPIEGMHPWSTIVMTGFGNVSNAVAAIKKGAFDFIEKPFSPEKLWSVIQRACEHQNLQSDLAGLRKQLSQERNIAGMVLGTSSSMALLRERMLQIGPIPVDVLLHGETGTGKELIARSLHQLSGARGSYVAVNCAGIPDSLFENELFGHEMGAFTGAVKSAPGKIELANNGTLFLDEIESMPINQQIKLLRVLQERAIERLGGTKSIPVNFRLIAATKTDLGQLSKEGKFRDDLWHRFNVVKFNLSSLRERREDIMPLFSHFLALACVRFKSAPPELSFVDKAQLLAHEWPGNVRELQHAAERFAIGQTLFNHPTEGSAASPFMSLEILMQKYEKEVIRTTLIYRQGDVKEAALDLAVSLKTLSRRIAEYELQSETKSTRAAK
jgi:two-component system, response regulator AauR